VHLGGCNRFSLSTNKRLRNFSTWRRRQPVQPWCKTLPKAPSVAARGDSYLWIFTLLHHAIHTAALSVPCSGVSGPEGCQRPKKRRARVHGDFAGLGCRRNTVGDDVQNLAVGDAGRLELARVAGVVHSVLEPEGRASQRAKSRGWQRAFSHHPSKVCGFRRCPWSKISWPVKKVPLSPKRCTSSTCSGMRAGNC
jgi:hypothetical protein